MRPSLKDGKLSVTLSKPEMKRFDKAAESASTIVKLTSLDEAVLNAARGVLDGTAALVKLCGAAPGTPPATPPAAKPAPPATPPAVKSGASPEVDGRKLASK